MANTLTVLDMVAARALKVAHEKATFISTIDRQFDDSFNASTNNSKNGATLRVRNPNMYTRRAGSRVMDVQDQNETTQTITVATQDGVDMRFNSQELSESIDYIDERYITPAVSSLVSAIDSDMIALFTKNVYNTAGTAGTVVGASADLSALFNARAKLNQGLAPKDKNRSLQLDSVTMASISSDGATSNTGFHACAPSTTVRLPAVLNNSAGSRSSISISSPVPVAMSTVEDGATTMNFTPWYFAAIAN